MSVRSTTVEPSKNRVWDFLDDSFSYALKSSSQVVEAHQENSGEATTSASGVIKFSSKYHDSETDLVYYGYRYLNTETGRWISRDPISERGGVNLMAFGLNSPPNKIDLVGLSAEESSCNTCNGVEYNPKKECCIRDRKGKSWVFLDEVQETGVQICCLYPKNIIGLPTLVPEHCWIEGGDFSGGFYPDGNPFGGPARVDSPESVDYMWNSEKKCTPVTQSPCNIDFGAFNSCMSKVVKEDPNCNYYYGGRDCTTWVKSTVNNCLESSIIAECSGGRCHVPR